MTWRREHPLDLTGLDLSGRILELGPGIGQLRSHIVAEGGEWVAVDSDPRAQVTMLDYDLNPEALPHGLFDGVYSRGSIGLLWESLPAIIDEIHDRMALDAWAWLSLWHGVAVETNQPPELNRRATPHEIYETAAWMSEYDFVLSKSAFDNQVLFTRGLS